MADIHIKDNDFMCRCSDEARQQCDAVKAKAFEDVGREKWGWDEAQCLDAILYNLALDGELRPMADQWGGLAYSLQDVRASIEKKEFVSSASCYIQCDSFIDGLAAVYLWKQQKEVKDDAANQIASDEGGE